MLLTVKYQNNPLQFSWNAMLQGWLEPGTGEVQLDFVAQFKFTASLFGWTFYRAPPLLVRGQMSTSKHGFL